jgi:membrane protease YdiL (CAAX protease family)
MNDSENIPQGERIIEPRALEATVSGANTYPPSWFSSEPPPSPEKIAEQLRLSRIPPDLRVPWGWTDVAVFALVYIGSTVLFAVAAAIAASAIQHIDLKALAKAPTGLFIELTVVAQVAASVVAMLYFFALTRIRNVGSFWSALGWHSLNGSGTNPATVVRYLLGGVGLSIAASASSLFLKHAAPTPIEELFNTRQTILTLMTFGILVAPVVEETIFRGFLYPVLARFGVVASVLFTGILFGASHTSNLGGALGQIAILVGVGIVLTWVRARSRSVLASFLMHTAYNSMVFVGVVIQTHGLRDFPAGK